MTFILLLFYVDVTSVVFEGGPRTPRLGRDDGVSGRVVLTTFQTTNDKVCMHMPRVTIVCGPQLDTGSNA